MNEREGRSARLKAILSRKHDPKETQEDVQARIRGIVEGSEHVCHHCGFGQFTGAIHPYGGISAKTKNQTRWCNGSTTIEPKDNPKTFECACPVCGQHWFYTQAELELYEGRRCHECEEKNRTICDHTDGKGRCTFMKTSSGEAVPCDGKDRECPGYIPKGE